MCLAIPAEVVEVLEGERATVDTGGVRKNVFIGLLDEVAVGDYILVHVGCALSRIDPEEAERTLRLFDEGVESIVSDNEEPSWKRAQVGKEVVLNG